MSWFVTALAWLGASDARAVIVYGPEGRILGAPTNPGQNQAWQFEGVWQGQYLGTPVAPAYFLTSAHIGGNVGDTFQYQGQSYTTTAVTTDPNSPDLQLWKVAGTFGTYADLYKTLDEAGKDLIAFGQGGPKGPIYPYQGTDRGWQFAQPDTVKSWGLNVVGAAGPVPDGTPGQFLTFQFSAALGPNTAALSPGDSGGGVFLQQNGVWKLAGVNAGVDGPFYTRPANDPNQGETLISGALYDTRGLYIDGSDTPVPDGGSPVGMNSYSTRVATEVGWIVSVTAVPEPRSWALLVSGGLALAWPLHRRRLCG